MTVGSSASGTIAQSRLFGTPNKSASTTHVRHGLIPPANLGYLAFPGGVSPSLVHEVEQQRLQEEEALRKQEAEEETRDQGEADAWKVEQEKLKEMRAARLAREAEEARKGEEYWVSCGGVLRDKHGNRDMERTKQIREELRLRELDRRLSERWESYERRWKDLIALSKSKKAGGKGNNEGERFSEASQHSDDDQLLKFTDIPWPAERPDGKAITFDDLRLINIQPFLFEPLSVRGCTVTKKERVRSSLLRWHPDKLTAIVDMVHPEEKHAVMEGIHAVVRRLQRLNAEL